MFRSKSERVERPPLRFLKQRSMSHRYNTCIGQVEDESIISPEGQGRSWLIRGSEKSNNHSRHADNGDVWETWWWKRWTNSVKRGVDQWYATEEKFTEDAAEPRSPRLKGRWGSIAKWFTREPRIISSIVYSRKAVRCQYDEFSYAQNFDEGNLEEEDPYPYRTFSARFAAPGIPLSAPGIPLSG